jgi:hypothetical protein
LFRAGILVVGADGMALAVVSRRGRCCIPVNGGELRKLCNLPKPTVCFNHHKGDQAEAKPWRSMPRTGTGGAAVGRRAHNRDRRRLRRQEHPRRARSGRSATGRRHQRASPSVISARCAARSRRDWPHQGATRRGFVVARYRPQSTRGPRHNGLRNDRPARAGGSRRRCWRHVCGLRLGFTCSASRTADGTRREAAGPIRAWAFR